MNTYLLLDNNSADYSFLTKEFGNIVYSPKKKIKILSWLIGCFNALLESHKNDVIVCWYDFQAVILYWISIFFFQKRRIVCLNILLKDKKTIKNKIVTWLYKIALSSTKFKATITSKEYGLLLNKKFNKSFQYTLLHDVFHSDYQSYDNILVENNTVFCGGRNGRDWNFMIDIVRLMPDVKFNIVAPQNIYIQLKKLKLPNVTLKTNISLNDFLHFMCSSEIVALPLDTEAPAGLIVMFQAAAYNKLILTTDTAVTREYIGLNMGYRIPKDVLQWQQMIKKGLSQKKESSTMANNFKDFLERNCNEHIFVHNVMNLIK